MTMYRNLLLTMITTFSLAPAFAVELSVGKDQIDAAANSYIIVFHDNVSASNVPELANKIAQAHAGAVRHTFKNTIRGFSATLPSQALGRIKNNPNE